MKPRIFLDTNVLLDFFLVREPFARQASQLPGPDYEDAVQYTSALDTKCTHLVTSNIKHFRNARIPVINARDAVKLLGLG